MAQLSQTCSSKVSCLLPRSPWWLVCRGGRVGRFGSELVGAWMLSDPLSGPGETGHPGLRDTGQNFRRDSDVPHPHLGTLDDGLTLRFGLALPTSQSSLEREGGGRQGGSVPTAGLCRCPFFRAEHPCPLWMEAGLDFGVSSGATADIQRAVAWMRELAPACVSGFGERGE